MKPPKSTYLLDDKEVTNYWIKTDTPEEYKPFEQVYGIVFNKKGEILIAREQKKDKWQIPGGKPKKQEGIKKTLKRELKEEVDIKIAKIKPLGVVKVILENNKEKTKREFYQLRYVCLLQEILPQTPDPVRGNTWERKFIAQEEVNDYIKWGEVGKAMFKDAINKFNNSLVSSNTPA